MWLQNVSIPLWRVIGSSEGEGVYKAKVFKRKYKAKLESSDLGEGGV